MRFQRKQATAARTQVLRLFSLLFFLAISAHAQQITVTLVGTGGPELTPSRSGIATLIQSDHQAILVDAGRNTLANLYRARINPATVTTVFLTHLHSDHISGLPDLWITPWFLLHRTTPLTVYGPRGTQSMIDGMRAMYAHDLSARANPTALARNLDVHVIEVADQQPIHLGSLTITPTTVSHADGAPAFAYRIANAEHSVFLTGDCTLTPALTAAAANADILIANVAAGTPEQESLPKWRPVFAKLLAITQTSELFRAAHPRLAVYSHIVTKGNVPDATLRSRTRKAGYLGPLLVGRDSTQIILDRRLKISHIPAPIAPLDGEEAATFQETNAIPGKLK
ncbi:MAG: MBL fold metallo-hydrolase [Acidobacteriaceae bacterium]|nr:MBL fold metallo-hydrolase [Acidobacteriaceae bacterium]